MKKTIILLIALVAMMSQTSCSLLDEEAKSELEKNKYMLDANEAQIVLLGVYSGMLGDAMYGYNLSILFPLGTDISQVEGSSNENFRIIPTNSFSANQLEIQQTWQALYSAIYNANDFLELIEEKKRTYSYKDQELAEIYIAEARALRALYYFELIRRYGNIALMTNTKMSNQHPSTFVQEDPIKVYEFIEQDLLHAIDLLPYAIDDSYHSTPDFRLSKGSALGLLAKVYATWAGFPIKDATKWEKAAKTAQILVESGKHRLLSDYNQLWKNSGAGIWDPEESLIEVSFYSPTATGGASDPIGRIGKWNGVKATAIPGERASNGANVKVVHTFVLDWRNNPQDLRRDISIANYQYNPNKTLLVKSASDSEATAIINDADPTKKQKEKQNYLPRKWDTEAYVPQSNKLLSNDKSNINWHILRYSDVLLIYAEALNEWKGSPTREAYEAVNLVRARGYGLSVGNSVSDLPSGLSQTAFREALWKERTYELAFEGHRKLDLIRWGVYYETVKQTAFDLGNWWSSEGSPNYAVATPGYTTKGKHELYPIPQRDLDLMNKFTQNPNWN